MKKLLICLLSFAMMISNLTVSAFADENEDEKDVPFYYVALGDSIGAGYELPGSSKYTVTSPVQNYKNDPVQSYPHLLAEELAELYGYDGDIYDVYSNMCLAASVTDDVIAMIDDPDYYISGETYFGHDAEELKVHDLLVSEIEKATTLTINVGNNDLIMDMIYRLAHDGSGVWYPAANLPNIWYTSSDGVTIKCFKSVENPLILAVWWIVQVLAQGEPIDADSVVGVLKAFIEFYTSDQTDTPLTYEDVVEAMEYFSTDNLCSIMIELAQTAEEKYPTMIEKILSINPDVDINIVSYYAALGNSLTVDGVTYDLDTVLSIIRQSMATQLVKYNYFTGASVEEYMNAVMADSMDQLTYPLVYLIMGQCTQAGVEELNSWLIDYCAQEGYDYIDIYDIPNENNTDPHPNEAGHVYIKEQCFDTMVKDVTVNVEGSEGTTVEGMTKVLSDNIPATYTINPEEGYKVNKVTVNGQEIDVVDNQFTVCIAQDSTINVSMVKEFPFTDVPEGKWYRSYVEDVYNLGLMTGTSETTFEPYKNINRGMLATILYRMAGSPEVEYKDYFSDVAGNKYYSNAITWAKENDIVKGYNDGTFKPSKDITRQELAIMLRNYAASLGIDVSADLSVLDKYPDASQISNYAKESMAWAVENNLITGDQGNLNPKGNATRAQTAKMLVVMNEMINK